MLNFAFASASAARRSWSLAFRRMSIGVGALADEDLPPVAGAVSSFLLPMVAGGLPRSSTFAGICHGGSFANSMESLSAGCRKHLSCTELFRNHISHCYLPYNSMLTYRLVKRRLNNRTKDG